MGIKLLAKLNFCFLIFLLGIQVPSFSQDNSPIFRDDFEREQLGEAWQYNTSWSIINGAAHNYIDGSGGFLRSSENYGNTAYVIETSAKGFTNNYWREFRITFGQKNLATDNMYVLSYTPNSGGQLTLAKSTDNLYFPEPLDEVIVYPDVEVEKWYKFKIAKYRNGIIKVYLDKGTGYSKVPLLEAIDLTYSELGHFGWQQDTQTSAESFYVDWIEAREPVNTEAITEKPAVDNLITQVSAVSGNFYHVAKLNVGEKIFTDREYTLTSVPDYLQGASFIQTANKDKSDTSASFLTSFIKKDAIVYVAFDPRATVLPAWLQDWEKTGDIIGTTDPGSGYYEVYSKLISSGQVYPKPFILGGNNASPAQGANMNYLVVAVEVPVIGRLEAEDATLVGAKVDNENTGYSGTGYVDYINSKGDYIEWTVQVDVPGTYSLGINFANGKDAPRPISFTVNEVGVHTFAFPSTLGWSNWGFYNGSAVYLTRGTHKIKATAVSNSGPNLDYLSLYYVSPAKTTVPYASIPVPIDNKANNRNSELSLENKPTHAYPNPFEGNTTISYFLKEKVPVNLTVYDMRGAKLKVLVDETQEAGNYKVNYTGTSLQKGLYIYKLVTGKEVKAVKLLKR